MNEHPGISPLDHYSDGKKSSPLDDTREKPESQALKTNYKDPATRYSLAARMVWAKTPRWKQVVIMDCRINGTDDRIFSEYSSEVVSIAENEKTKFDESLPEVPTIPKRTKIIDPAVV